MAIVICRDIHVSQTSLFSRKEDGSIITDLFGLDTVTRLRCRCGIQNERQTTSTLVNLSYPDCSGQGLYDCQHFATMV